MNPNDDQPMEPAARQLWQQWVCEHAPRVLLFARQQVRQEADAQDIAQEALVEAWRRAGGDGPPPPALVFATVRRRAIDLAREGDRRSAREQVACENIPQFDTSATARETGETIEHAMKAIPDIYREVITLKIWGELTFEEIASVLAIPANTAASRYRYGLAELRKHAQGILT